MSIKYDKRRFIPHELLSPVPFIVKNGSNFYHALSSKYISLLTHFCFLFYSSTQEFISSNSGDIRPKRHGQMRINILTVMLL